MAAWKEIVTDFIRAKLSNGKVGFGTKAEYKTHYTAVDFAPNDIPNWEAVLSLLGAYGLGLKVPFTGVSNYTIADWQTDIPPGQTATYVEIFGNQAPKVNIWIGNDTAGYDLLTSMSAHLGAVTGGALSTVFYDWGESLDGFIQF